MTKRMGLYPVLMLVGALILGAATVMGGPLPVGALVGSRNATLDGQAPLPHTTLLGGDNLQVNNDGLAMVALDQGNRMILGRGTAVSFLRQADGVTVSLARGNVSLYHSQQGSEFNVRAGDVTVSPAKGYRTLGEIAMADGLLLVTAKGGALEVEKSGTMQEVANGKTITLAMTAAGAPAPVPPRRHLKHIIIWGSPEGPSQVHITQPNLWVIGAITAGGAVGLAYLIDELTESGPSVSPVKP